MKKWYSFVFGCLAGFIWPFALHAQQVNIPVFVVQEAWHTGIVIQTNDVPDTALTELDAYKHYDYIDIGWGDRDFYQTPGFPVWFAFKAIFWPTEAVIRVAAFNRTPRTYYSTQAKLAKLQLTQQEFEALCRYISGSFAKNEKGEAIPSKLANFYISAQKYSLFRTCNTWAANAFKTCGLDVRSFLVLLASQLFRQLEKAGHEVIYVKTG